MSLKILLVDDEVDLIEIIGSLLESEGHVVTYAQNGVEAMEKLNEQSFDLLIVDNHMPKMTGVEVIQQLNIHKPEGLKIVFSSGNSLKLVELVDQNHQFGVVDYVLNKPYKFTEIQDVITQLF